MTDETLFCDQPWGVLKDNIKNLNCSTSSWFAELSDKDKMVIRTFIEPEKLWEEMESIFEFGIPTGTPVDVVGKNALTHFILAKNREAIHKMLDCGASINNSD